MSREVLAITHKRLCGKRFVLVIISFLNISCVSFVFSSFCYRCNFVRFFLRKLCWTAYTKFTQTQTDKQTRTNIQGQLKNRHPATRYIGLSFTSSYVTSLHSVKQSFEDLTFIDCALRP